MTARIALGVLIIVEACGPIQTTVSISRAEEKLKQARLANAENDAPYEMTAAALYLDMAKQREGRSEFEGAKTFGDEAFRLADEAIKNAPENARRREIRGKNVVGPNEFLTNPALLPNQPAGSSPGVKR